MARGGYVKRLIRHGCSSDLSISVYIEVSAIIGVTSLWNLIAPGCSGIQTARLGKPDFGHRKMKAFFDKATGASQQFSTRLLWPTLLAPARAIGWYWLVADTAANAAINWTTLLYAEQSCQLPSQYRADIPVLPWNLLPFSPSLVPFGGPTDRMCAKVDFMHILIPIGCQVSLTYELSWSMIDPNGHPGDNVTTQLMVDDAPVDQAVTTNWQAATPNGNTFGAGYRIGGLGSGVGRSVSIHCTHGGAYWSLDRGSVSMSIAGHEIPIFSLPDCFRKKGGVNDIFNNPNFHG
jgi:hypothetical protein